MSAERVTAHEEVLAALAIRDAVRNPRYFVGRQEELGIAAAVYLSTQPGAFVWIHGPRRMGKTSLSFELLRLARERDALTSRVDLLTLDSDVSFGGLLEAAMAHLSEPVAPTSGDPWTRFDALVRACQRPLLFVFDEMDRLGPRLSEEQQSKLRGLKQECPALRCVFISRIDPNRLVEDYPLVSSRLLGVCNFIHLKPLSRPAVRSLCAKVRGDLALAGDGRVWADAIWERVGGYSVSVMGLVHRMAVAAAVSGSDDPEQLERALEEGLLDQRADLEGYWWDLPARTRSALLQVSEQKPADWRAVGLWERDEPVRPSCLLEVGRELGRVRRSAPSEGSGDSALGRIELVHDLVATVSESLKLRGYRQPFETTSELFKYARAVRGGEDREGAGRFVDYMYKLCYEAARERQADKPWRLPQALAEFYKRHRLIGDVSDLRNFFFHDQNRPSDTERPSSTFGEAAAILERRCGTSDPRTADDWRRLRDSILDDAVALLEELYARSETTERAPGSDHQ
jgi:hypothetical protein